MCLNGVAGRFAMEVMMSLIAIHEHLFRLSQDLLYVILASVVK